MNQTHASIAPSFRPKSPQPHASKAFSLVELLVVVGIIAAFLALLFPVVSMVRKSARGAACLANLGQWGQSYQMYLNNNGGRSFLSRRSMTDFAWYEELKPYNGDIHRTLLCPEAIEPGNAIGSDVQAWGPNRTYNVSDPQWQVRDTFVGSYGFNAWLFRIPAADLASAAPVFGKHAIELPTAHVDRIPVLADCIEEWATPLDTDTPPYNLHHPIPFSNGTQSGPPGPSGMMAYFCIDRHNRAVNVAFLDGHAARIPLAELWHLKWNAAFTPRDVVLPP